MRGCGSRAPRRARQPLAPRISAGRSPGAPRRRAPARRDRRTRRRRILARSTDDRSHDAPAPASIQRADRMAQVAVQNGHERRRYVAARCGRKHQQRASSLENLFHWKRAQRCFVGLSRPSALRQRRRSVVGPRRPSRRCRAARSSGRAVEQFPSERRRHQRCDCTRAR